MVYDRYELKHNIWEAICGYPMDDPTKACPEDSDGHAAPRDQVVHCDGCVAADSSNPDFALETARRAPCRCSETPPWCPHARSWSYSGVSISTLSSRSRTRATRGHLTPPSSRARTAASSRTRRHMAQRPLNPDPDPPHPKATPPTDGPWEYVVNLKATPQASPSPTSRVNHLAAFLPGTSQYVKEGRRGPPRPGKQEAPLQSAHSVLQMPRGEPDPPASGADPNWGSAPFGVPRRMPLLSAPQTAYPYS